MSNSTAAAPAAPSPAPARDYAAMFDLTGRQALVVGAGSGIGRECAIAIAAHGARVCCADLDLTRATETAELAGHGATGYALDMRDEAAIGQAVSDLPDTDILVFTAATNIRKRILDYTAADAEAVLALNLQAPFALLRGFGPGMVSRGRGSVIGFTSIRATTTEPGQAMYAATKAALVQLLRTAAVEWGPAGVRVNLVSPGVVNTPLTTQIRAVPEWYDAYADKTMFGRWAEAHEMAGAVVYLASDAASYVTGSVLMVDGGWTAADGRFTPPA